MKNCHRYAVSFSAFLLSMILISTTTSEARVVSENITRALTMMPDGYKVRSPHFPKVELHQSTIYFGNSGYVILREYSTPFGLVSTVQRPLRLIRSRARASSLTTSGIEVPVLFSGRTTRGADWFLVVVDRRWRLHLQFQDGVTDLWIPISTSEQVIATIAEGVY